MAGPVDDGDGSEQSLIERDPQNIALPVGGFATVRQRRRTSMGIKWWRANAPNLVAAAGLIAAVIGASMALSSPSIPVYQFAGAIHIGNSVLTEKSKGVYVGDATLIAVGRADGTLVSSASTYADGNNVAGRCVTAMKSKTLFQENCSFWIGSATSGAPTFTSVDTYDTAHGEAWHRHYSDGRDVQITVPSSDALWPAMPLPVGR